MYSEVPYISKILLSTGALSRGSPALRMCEYVIGTNAIASHAFCVARVLLIEYHRSTVLCIVYESACYEYVQYMYVTRYS